MMSKPIWDSIKLYFSGDEYFRDVCTSIEQAQTEVLIESYTFDLDPIGLRILKYLEAATQRGVQCRILIDGIGSLKWSQELQDECKKRGILVRIYHPIPFQNKILHRFSLKSITRILSFLKRINKRDHRKVILVDRKIAFLGGLNISQVHTQEFMGPYAWRDTGVCVSGEALTLLRTAYFQAWRNSRFVYIDKRLNIYKDILRLNNSVRWRFQIARDLSQRFRHAKTRILITNPYFIPKRSVLLNLKKAAKRGSP